MKKIITSILALVLLFSLNATSFAASATTGTITVNNAKVGQTYKIYKILNLATNEDYTAFSYTAVPAWEGFLNSAEIKDEYIVFEENYIKWKNGADVSTFARLANEYAIDNSIPATASATATAVADETTTTIEFDNLSLGYYMLDSTFGAYCSLTTNKPDAEITEKNTVPSLVKEVKKDAGYGYYNDISFSEDLEYRITIDAFEGAENYVIHDKMDTGIDFLSITKVERVSNSVTTEMPNSIYTLNTTPTDGDTFDLSFAKSFLDTIENDKIIVYYSARLNEDAVIAGEGNKNEAKLTYGDPAIPENVTSKSVTTTYTWNIPILKYAMVNGTQTPLKGAKFLLYYTITTTDGEGTNTTTYYYAETDAQENLTSWTTDENSATQLTSDNLGKIDIKGLDSGTYYLKEIEPPAGYNLLSTSVKIDVISSADEVNNTMSCSLQQNGVTVTQIEVENKTGDELPTTGGIGTTIIYILGIALLLVAGVLLVVKKRMSVEESDK